MSVIAMEIAMQHLRADSADQPLVALLLSAAEQAARDYLDREFYADADALAVAVLAGDAGDDPIVINDAIKAACLLILGNLYANREDTVVGVSAVQLPNGSRSLLHPHRIGLGV